MKKNTRSYGLLAAAAVLSIGIGGCSSVQDTADQAANKASEAAGGMADAAKDAGGQAADAARNAAGGAADAAKGAGSAASGQLQDILSANPVTFTSQSAALSAKDTKTLQQIGGVLKSTGAPVTVTTYAGYPDAAKARQLSQQRVEAIVKALEAAGVDAAKITKKAEGNAVQGDEALKAKISSP
jgi:outer membrane protein OmpA-like peptidoglycan-associated protein